METLNKTLNEIVDKLKEITSALAQQPLAAGYIAGIALILLVIILISRKISEKKSRANIIGQYQKYCKIYQYSFEEWQNTKK